MLVDENTVKVGKNLYLRGEHVVYLHLNDRNGEFYLIYPIFFIPPESSEGYILRCSFERPTMLRYF